MLMWPCNRVARLADAHVRNELSAADSASLQAHGASCTACAAVLAEAEAARSMLSTVKAAVGPDEALFDDLALVTMRRSVLAEVRQLAAEKRHQRSSLLGGFTMAAAAAALTALVVGGPTGVVVPPSSVSPSVAELPADLQVPISLKETAEGTTVRWQGEGTFEVQRSSSARFDQATVTTVCGSSWVDHDVPSGVVFYRVRPARRDC